MTDLFNTGKGLVVLGDGPDKRIKNGTLYRTYEVRCFCGNTFYPIKGNFRNGGVRSCGCARIAAITTHGGWRSPEYQSWKAMKARCLNPKSVRYNRYGGRGITICERWLGENGFANFLEDMGRRERKDLTLDRINPDGNYEPSNCRWADKLTQTLNTNYDRSKGVYK